MTDISDSLDLLEKATAYIRRITEGLLGAVPIDADEVSKDSVPPERGIYIWRFKGDGSPAYIGVGLGSKGLRQRIVRQHLCHYYIKSVFRKAVEKHAEVGPRLESVEYIRANFTLAFVTCPDGPLEWAEAAETFLITTLKPHFNKAKRRVTERNMEKRELRII